MSRISVALAAALAGATVCAAACSGSPNGPGVASATHDASPSSSASASTGPLAYSECMRAHGIPNFPDPNGNGGIEFNASNVNPATYNAARQACASLRSARVGNAGSPRNQANALKFAKCMRAHGVLNFPDPNSNGGFSGTGGIDPASPTFQQAQSLCLKQEGQSGSGSAS